MKTATLPPVRVDPKLKRAVEAVLEPGETLSEFIVQSVSRATQVRAAQREFVDRAEARSARAKKTGRYVPAAAVYKRMEQLLTRARKKAR